MGPDGAAISHSMTDETSRLTKTEWDAISHTMVAMSYDDFGWIRATIEKLCSDHKGVCKDETQKKIAEFSKRTRLAAMRARRKEAN